MNFYIKKNSDILLIFSTFLFFIYIYPLYFNGIPLSSRIIYAILGMGTIIYGRYIKLSLLYPLKGLIPIFAVSILTGIINRTFDFCFAKYCISVLMFFFAAIFVYNILNFIYKRNQTLNIDFLIKLFIICVTIQSIISILMFLIPSFTETLYTFFSVPESEEATLEENIGMRLVGLGSYFFAAGVIHGLSLIFIVYLYLKNKIKRKWIIVYIFNFFVGLLMARTTVIGFAVSIIFMIIWKPLNIFYIKQKFKWGIYLIFLFIIALIGIIMVVDEEVLKWAFEFFYNYSDSGSFESSSTNRLKEMYVIPTNFFTYLIGDGKYNLPEGGYYMSTDVGYLRLLYYGGIPMIISFYFFMYYISKYIIKYNTSIIDKYLFFIIFLYLIILNFKGLADLNSVLIIIYIFSYLNYYQRKHSVNPVKFQP